MQSKHRKLCVSFILIVSFSGTARGTIQINKKTFSGSEFRHLSAYVLQVLSCFYSILVSSLTLFSLFSKEDLLFGNLTVRETLMYAAKLRLPSSVSVKSKEELVQGLIEELGLVKCADSEFATFLSACSPMCLCFVCVCVQIMWDRRCDAAYRVARRNA